VSVYRWQGRGKHLHPDLIERIKDLSADKGYDSADNIRNLWPVIDIRDAWREEKWDQKLKGEGLSQKKGRKNPFFNFSCISGFLIKNNFF
jgi:hypothetical protein